jgi:3-oxoacyl-[acyl-carrier-protein] synthase-1
MKPVYLHGRALISALGMNLQEAVAGISAGKQAVQRIELADGTEWPYFRIGDTEPDWYKRAQRLIRAAAQQAGLAAESSAPLFVASSSLDIGAIETGASVPEDSYAFAEKIAAWLDWTGPVYLVSSACTSALQALLQASRLVGSGTVNDAVVIGVELANRYSVSGFAAMQLLTPDKPEPLGLNRNGIALGEAVGILHLSNRPARWQMCGGSHIVNGSDPTGAIPQTVAQMCEQALASSGITAGDIDLIKLQAAGSVINDLNELTGSAAAFASLPPLVTFKNVIGHTLGASGAAEIALLTACLENNVWPHADYPLDSGLPAGLTHARPDSVRYVLANILGFGGGHSTVILEDTYDITPAGRAKNE